MSLPSIQSMKFTNSRTRKRIQSSHFSYSFSSLNPKQVSPRVVVTRVTSRGDRFDDNVTQKVFEGFEVSGSPSSGDGYVGLFIRMLGLDNDILDREQAVDALWKYSLGGKKCIDEIMKSGGSVFLTVNLLNSESSVACEAAGDDDGFNGELVNFMDWIEGFYGLT